MKQRKGEEPKAVDRNGLDWRGEASAGKRLPS